MHKFSQEIGVPTHFVSLDEGRKLEPYVQAKTGILESPTTGIIDSHSYMQYLLGSFTDLGGDVALNSLVTAIEPLQASTPGSGGYAITTKDRTSGEELTFETEVLINSAGLAACDISNMILPESRHMTPFFAKGNYFSYSGSKPSTSRLIYPAPEPGLAGLGTHLTLDISGRIKFGPDVEWVDDASDMSVNDSRMGQAVEQILKYLPSIDVEKLSPDYAGIRPKLGRGGSVAGTERVTDGKSGPKGESSKGNFMDFVIRKEEGWEGFVNLLGIESPGLTSSLAIGDMVDGLLYK